MSEVKEYYVKYVGRYNMVPHSHYSGRYTFFRNRICEKPVPVDLFNNITKYYRGDYLVVTKEEYDSVYGKKVNGDKVETVEGDISVELKSNNGLIECKFCSKELKPQGIKSHEMRCSKNPNRINTFVKKGIANESS